MKRVLTMVLLAAMVPPTLAVAKTKKEVVPPPVEAPAPPPPDPEAWRATAPTAGVEPTWAPPEAKVFTLSNGIPVYLVENPGLPLVTVDLLMGVGREANPAGKAGLAALTTNLLDEGTTTRTGSQIAAEAAMLGANLSVGQGDEMASVSLDALTGASLGASLDLMADVALHPRFDKADVTRVKTETLTAIQAQKAEPGAMVGRAFAAQTFGTNHPYGTPSIGSEASIAAIGPSDPKHFYTTWWHSKNAAIVVSGAVTQAEIQPLLQARFGTWKAGKATRLAVTPPSPLAKTRVVFIEQPGAVQSVIRLGTVGLSRTSPDFMAANMAGTLVAGTFSSPINMNLREEHGWSYGAFGGFSEVRDFGTFSVRTSVQADKTAPAVAEIMKELAKATATAPADAEVRAAKDYLKKSLAGSFETNSATAGAFESVPEFGLGPDLWQKYPSEVEAVTVPQIQSMEGRYFDAARQLIVVAGPRTVEVPGEGGATTKIDVVAGLKGLGYEFVDLGAPVAPATAPAPAPKKK